MTAPVRVGPSPVGGGPAVLLTARDLDLLRRVANGATYGQLAREWGLAELSVRSIGAKAQKKLGAKNITHAVYLACLLGLIPMTSGPKSGETPIGPSLRLLRSLMAEGFSVSFIATRMGMAQSELSVLMGRLFLTAAMETRVLRVFVELAGRDPLKLGVHQRGYTRARNRGRAECWEIVSDAETAEIRAVTHAA